MNANQIIEAQTQIEKVQKELDFHLKLLNYSCTHIWSNGDSAICSMTVNDNKIAAFCHACKRAAVDLGLLDI